MKHVARSEPDVSAIIATRGRAQLLRRAVSSIASQDYEGSIQIIVIFDQCEIDELEDLRDTFGPNVTLTAASNSRTPGLAGGRNSGISLAASPLIAFCDDDDEWMPEKLRAQIAMWNAHPDAAIVSAGISIVTQEGRIDRIPPTVVRRADLLQSRIGELHPSSFLFRREDLSGLPGGVDEELPAGYGEDYDLLLRVAEMGSIVSAPECLVAVHWDRDSYFAGRWAPMAEGLSYVLEKHPDLLDDARNGARMCGQIAFAHAAAGNAPAARSWIRRTLRHRVVEPRAYLAALAMFKIVSPRVIINALNKQGRGI